MGLNSIIASATSGMSVPPGWVSSIIGVESGGNPSAISPTGVRGIAQITGDTWKTLYPDGPPYSTDTTAQIDASAKLLNEYYVKYGGDPSLVALAYSAAGPGTANAAEALIKQGYTTADAISAATQSLTPSRRAEALGEVNKFNKALGNSDPDVSSTASDASDEAATETIGVDDASAVDAVPVSGETIDGQAVGAVLAAINPPLVVKSGLDSVPWFSDTNLTRDNPDLARQFGYPVTFQVYMDRNMTVPLGLNGTPLSLCLNASLGRVERSIRANNNRSFTRTAVRVVMWGMHPDVITGTGSTGLFMNKLGVSDYLSVASPDAEVRRLFDASLHPPRASLLTDESMRVAVKDAFIEFLQCFEMNAVVWNQTKNYDGSLTALEPSGPGAWSAQTGASSYQLAARNNDVQTRGYVVMKYRNSIYAGYFKSLSFEMDAEKPFQWNFNFTFQVERTLTAVPIAPGVSNA